MARNGDQRRRHDDNVAASNPEQDRGGRRRKKAGERLYHDAKLWEGEVVDGRWLNGGASWSSELGNGGGTN